MAKYQVVFFKLNDDSPCENGLACLEDFGAEKTIKFVIDEKGNQVKPVSCSLYYPAGSSHTMLDTEVDSDTKGPLIDLRKKLFALPPSPNKGK